MRIALRTAIHTSATIGRMTRAKAPSGAQTPSLAHVVPPATPSTTTATPTANTAFEIALACHSPNDPAMISIAAGNQINTVPAAAKSFSPR